MDYNEFNYDQFNDETKKYINMVMDLYSTIKDKDIIRRVKHITVIDNYQFTKIDKKILSLFIAGFMVDGNLKEILQEYDDIKLKDLLSFANIELENINKLSTDEYAKFYKQHFQLELVDISKLSKITYDINIISPEVIMWFFAVISVDESDILNYFGNQFTNKKMWFGKHPLFKALKSYSLINGYISEKNIGLYRKHYSNINLNRPEQRQSDYILKQLQEQNKFIIKPNKQPKKTQSTIDFDSDSIWELLDEIQKKFIGQEQVTEELFYNIVNNQQLAQMEKVPDGQRSIIFLDGPSGTGKTAITREITEKLGIPFTATSITNYSATGYKGGDITDVLTELYKKANGDMEKAQRGIVVFDEFDKIAYSRVGGLEMKRAVQQQLLNFLGGGKYKIVTGNNLFDMKEEEFDTSKLTFVCLGALTDLRTQKTQIQQPIGFGLANQQTEQLDYTITPQDLMGIGLEKELVGRFNTYLHTNDYNRESLVKILKESTINPLIGFRQWIESRGKVLEVDDSVYDIIADQAYELNTGARSLQTVMNNIRTPFIKEVLRGTNPTIHLDEKTVLQIAGQTMNRKGRS